MLAARAPSKLDSESFTSRFHVPPSGRPFRQFGKQVFEPIGLLTGERPIRLTSFALRR